MVCLREKEAIKQNYEAHLEEILKSGKRFAVVERDNITYHEDIESVYEQYPMLSPGLLKFGTAPKLVNIGKETNSLEYRKDKLEDDSRKLQEAHKMLKEQERELEKRRKELETEESN